MRFSSPSSADYWMGANGFYCGFNTPAALKGERTHGLPPYAKRMGFLVDKYPACPENWVRSEGKVTSFFVPVAEGKGMWLDLNKTNDENQYHVAAVISVQGVNAITGLPCEDAQLEQYLEECPKHKIKFGPNRFCEKCNYKWPKQNYLSTTGTPRGSFWLDGFRSAEGCVRQYILTAEEMRGVASNVIGKDRVFAVGISFFLSHEQRPQPERTILRGNTVVQGWDIYEEIGAGMSYIKKSGCDSTPHMYHLYSPDLTTFDTPQMNSSDGSTKISCSDMSAKEPQARGLYSASVRRKSAKPVDTKKLEVGAGAKISQSVHDDPNPLDFWRDDPEAILCINYVTEVDAQSIIEAGEIDLEGSDEGFLQDIPVGN